MKRPWFSGLGSAVILGVSMASAALAAEVSLTVSIPSPLAEGGTASTQLRMGVVPGATTGFDSRRDVPAPPAPSESLVTLSAYVLPPPMTSQSELLWDFREETLPQTWTVEVISDQTAPITLGWSATGSGDACAPIEWHIEDQYSGARMNMGTGPEQYQYLGSSPRTRRFVVTVEALPGQQAPSVPSNLWSPRQGRGSVYLAWSGSGSAVRYHVYRDTGGGDIRLTPVPIATTSYVDTGVDRSIRSIYRIRAVIESGCESEFSSALTVAPHR